MCDQDTFLLFNMVESSVGGPIRYFRKRRRQAGLANSHDLTEIYLEKNKENDVNGDNYKAKQRKRSHANSKNKDCETRSILVEWLGLTKNQLETVTEKRRNLEEKSPLSPKEIKSTNASLYKQSEIVLSPSPMNNFAELQHDKIIQSSIRSKADLDAIIENEKSACRTFLNGLRPSRSNLSHDKSSAKEKKSVIKRKRRVLYDEDYYPKNTRRLSLNIKTLETAFARSKNRTSRNEDSSEKNSSDLINGITNKNKCNVIVRNYDLRQKISSPAFGNADMRFDADLRDNYRRYSLCNLSELKIKLYADGKNPLNKRNLKSTSCTDDDASIKFQRGQTLTSQETQSHTDNNDHTVVNGDLTLERVARNFDQKNVFLYTLNKDYPRLMHYFSLGYPADVIFDRSYQVNKKNGAISKLSRGSNLLHAAVLSNSVDIVNLCLMNGLCMDHVNEEFRTPLHLAIKHSSPEIVQIAVENTRNKKFLDDEHSTYLHHAAARGHPAIVDLVAPFCCVDAQDDNGWTPLSHALALPFSLASVMLINRYKANVMILDREGNSALHWAAYYNSDNALDCILTKMKKRNPMNIDLQNVEGDTALHIAVRRNSDVCITKLLRAGVNPTLKNSDGRRPIDLCAEGISKEVYNVLTMFSKRWTASSMSLLPTINKVVCADVSNGRERYPIPCINNIDNEPAPCNFVYIVTNIYSAGSAKMRWTNLDPCACNDDCGSLSCSCCKSSTGVCYGEDGCLVPTFDRNNSPYIFECNSLCSCSSKDCNNRIVQRGHNRFFQLFKTTNRGWGVRTMHFIPRGGFVCEYVGEYIKQCKTSKRETDSYIFDLGDRGSTKAQTYCLDAFKYGSIARFVNHSCEPNLFPVRVFTTHLDFDFPQICLFAIRDVQAGEELGFDYGESFWKVKLKYFSCNCGSRKCKYQKPV